MPQKNQPPVKRLRYQMQDRSSEQLRRDLQHPDRPVRTMAYGLLLARKAGRRG